jgi:hypothetical protein
MAILVSFVVHCYILWPIWDLFCRSVCSTMKNLAPLAAKSLSGPNFVVESAPDFVSKGMSRRLSTKLEPKWIKILSQSFFSSFLDKNPLDQIVHWLALETMHNP